MIAEIALLASMAGPEMVGGYPLEHGVLPWLARVGTRDLACSGALVAPGWVLTAAHCAEIARDPEAFVLLNAESLDDPRASRHAIVDVAVIPTYADENRWHDLALAHISPPATVRPIDLSLAPQPGRVAATMIAGWGWETYPDGDRTTPRWAAVDALLPADECGPAGRYDDAQNVCVRGAQGQGPCHGDSGGPLWDNTGLLGVASRGPSGCDSDRPSIYISVGEPEHRRWVEDTIAGYLVARLEAPQGAVSGIGLLRGWVASSDGHDPYRLLEVEIDGRYAFSLPCCGDRGDVAEEILGASLWSGFAGLYNWELERPGTHDLAVRIGDSAGDQLVLRQTVEVQ